MPTEGPGGGRPRHGVELDDLVARPDVFFTSPHLISQLFAPHQLHLTRLDSRKRTGPDFAVRDIGAHHHASGRNLRAHEPQRSWPGGLAEEPLAPPEHHRKRPHVVLVDQCCGLQRLDQIAAADNLQVRARLLLEGDDCRNDIAMKQGRVVPVERRQGARRDILSGGH